MNGYPTATTWSSAYDDVEDCPEPYPPPDPITGIGIWVPFAAGYVGLRRWTAWRWEAWE